MAVRAFLQGTCTDVNKVCLMDGKLAEKTGEIAIDRMYADNNDLKIGDTLEDGTKSWTVTGLVALSDYAACFRTTVTQCLSGKIWCWSGNGGRV